MPFLIILGILIVLLLVYLALIAPTKNEKIEKYRKTLFAHRGLHGEGRAENSISAFRAAVEAGYGIELDVRLSSDGELVVFHDDTLDRICAISGKVSDFTAEELSKMSLSGTSDGVPRFSEVLSLVSGRVPLLVEIKEDAGDCRVSDKTVEILREYGGDYIIESFNPLSLGNVAKKMPEVPRGILSQNYYKNEKYRKPLYYILKILLLNRICKPSFIAYDHEDYKCISLRIVRRLFGAVTFAWTVRSPKEEMEARAHGFDSVIFENYIPR